MVQTRASGTRKILIHAINFAPEIIGCGKYTTELAQYLSSRGYQVEIITAPPHYPGWSVHEPYRAFAYAAEMLGAIRIIRCPILTKANGGALWRLLAPLSFAVTAAPVVAWRIFQSRPDVVFCVEPTLFSAPVALTMAKILRRRCVLHVQDLEVDAAFEVGYVKGFVPRKVAIFIESIILNGFDRIITISNKMRDRLIAKNVDPSRISMIRNWVAPAITPIAQGEPNAFRGDLGITDTQFIVLYAGHIGAKQALDVVLAAARHLRDRGDIHFVIAGDGPMKQHLMGGSADLANVSYLPSQPVSRLNELLGMADLHVLPQYKGVADLVFPSKLGGMLASGRPIVATVEAGTELFEFLTNVALITPAGDGLALSEAICRAKNEDISKLSENGLQLVESLAASRLLGQFERELFDISETVGPSE
jgi:colanic acid biosynthesis glycosyl transferase WcaI